MRRSGSAALLRKKKKFPTSIRLEEGMMVKLKEKAEKRGIGHLTMMKIIVYENVNRH